MEMTERRIILKSLLYDVLGILLPGLLFVNIALMVFGNMVPFRYLQSLMAIMGPLFLLFLFTFNIIFIYKKGCTCGNYFTHTSLYDANQQDASTRTQCLHEWLEKGIPSIVIYLVFGFIGVVVYALFAVIFICIDGKHRSWVDLCLHTHLNHFIARDDSTTIHIQI